MGNNGWWRIRNRKQARAKGNIRDDKLHGPPSAHTYSNRETLTALIPSARATKPAPASFPTKAATTRMTANKDAPVTAPSRALPKFESYAK